MISLISNLTFAVKLPENLHITEQVKKDIKQVSALKIDKKYKEFVYNKEFAKLLHLDKSKAIKMPKDMYGAGVTIEEVSPETDERFAQYKVKFHLFVKHNDDYALPEDRWGDWFGASKMQDEIEQVIGKDEVPLNQDFMMDYNMRSFIGNDDLASNENIPDNYYVRAGSLVLNKYQKNAYNGIDYISYGIDGPNFPKFNQNISIWLRKSNGRDYRYSSSGPTIAKDFYNFQIPKILRKNSCNYSQKAYLQNIWNLSLEYDLNTFLSSNDFFCKE